MRPVPKCALCLFVAAKRLLVVPRIVSAWLIVLALASPAALGDALEVIRKIPHTGYSEGLDFHEGYLWHALPKEIVKIDPKDGTVVARFKPGSEYSESVAWFKGKLVNLSYSDNGIYEGKLAANALAFERKGTTPEAHGWGITQDGKQILITGNYSHKIYFLGEDYKVKRVITSSVSDLEDLAWDGKGIWTSSFTSHKGSIFRVDPKTGAISALFTLPAPEECPVIDGIAYDGKNLWVTGKNCISIYLIKKPSERQLSGKGEVSPKKK